MAEVLSNGGEVMKSVPMVEVLSNGGEVMKSVSMVEVISNGGEVMKSEGGEGIVKGGGASSFKKNRIQVSNTKKPLFFYVNLAKKYMRLHEEVELSALGMAIATVVTISEILKNNGLAIEKKILTSTVGMKDETKGKMVQKAKIEILLGKSENFENLTAVASKAAEDDKENKEDVNKA